MSSYKIDFNSLPWEFSQTGARFKAFQQGNRKLRLLEFTDQFVETEWCTKRHIGIVLEGELDLNFNGEIVRFKAGDGLFILEGEAGKHKAIVQTEVVKMILVEDA